MDVIISDVAKARALNVASWVERELRDVYNSRVSGYIANVMKYYIINATGAIEMYKALACEGARKYCASLLSEAKAEAKEGAKKMAEENKVSEELSKLREKVLNLSTSLEREKNRVAFLEKKNKSLVEEIESLSFPSEEEEELVEEDLSISAESSESSAEELVDYTEELSRHLEGKKVVFAGYTIPIKNRLSQLHPDLVLIPGGEMTTNVSLLASADVVFTRTRTMCHPLYWQIKSNAKEYAFVDRNSVPELERQMCEYFRSREAERDLAEERREEER